MPEVRKVLCNMGSTMQILPASRPIQNTDLGKHND